MSEAECVLWGLTTVFGGIAFIVVFIFAMITASDCMPKIYANNFGNWWLQHVRLHSHTYSIKSSNPESPYKKLTHWEAFSLNFVGIVFFLLHVGILFLLGLMLKTTLGLKYGLFWACIIGGFIVLKWVSTYLFKFIVGVVDAKDKMEKVLEKVDD
jgi:hypothetical protein